LGNLRKKHYDPLQDLRVVFFGARRVDAAAQAASAAIPSFFKGIPEVCLFFYPHFNFYIPICIRISLFSNIHSKFHVRAKVGPELETASEPKGLSHSSKSKNSIPKAALWLEKPFNTFAQSRLGREDLICSSFHIKINWTPCAENIQLRVSHSLIGSGSARFHIL
jgi:hypothetical protein